ncbi:MAG TPA: hypothetical protein VIL34_00995 [Actinopolymorphaceae bacterium]|jgi:hypothetical protein
MSWRSLEPVPIDLRELPTEWRLIHEPELDHYAVIGITDPGDPHWETVDVVIRVDFAVDTYQADIRHRVASLVAKTIAATVANTCKQSPRHPKGRWLR